MTQHGTSQQQEPVSCIITATTAVGFIILLPSQILLPLWRSSLLACLPVFCDQHVW
jgi:hypothetical protein